MKQGKHDARNQEDQRRRDEQGSHGDISLGQDRGCSAVPQHQMGLMRNEFLARSCFMYKAVHERTVHIQCRNATSLFSSEMVVRDRTARLRMHWTLLQ